VSAAAPSAVVVRPALEALAGLVTYPGEGFARRAAEARAVLSAEAPALARTATPFFDACGRAAGEALEEAYARTFDWSATCALEVGWHLFGERYERGAFLVGMRARLREAGVEEGEELPDHLSSCLRWLARAEEGPARDFASKALAKAVARMRAGLGDADPAWAALLRAVEEAVAGVAGGPRAEGAAR
jgi:nitrate reductase molybdenum cofactor assembly chaperone